MTIGYSDSFYMPMIGIPYHDISADRVTISYSDGVSPPRVSL